MILCIRRQLDFELLAKGFKVLQSVALVNGTSISVENKIRKYVLFYNKLIFLAQFHNIFMPRIIHFINTFMCLEQSLPIIFNII